MSGIFPSTICCFSQANRRKLRCIYDHSLGKDKCDPFDYTCICKRLQKFLWDPSFEKCYSSCNGSQDQICRSSYSSTRMQHVNTVALGGPSSIRNMCESVQIALNYPPFFQTQYLDLNKRQRNPVSRTSSVSALPPRRTTMTDTITFILPYGDAPYTSYTSDGFGARTVTKIIGISQTRIAYTIRKITTVPNDAAGFTYTLSNPNAQAVTVLVGIPGSTRAPGATGAPKTASIPEQTQKHSPGGLSTGAKIGIGITIPLIVLVLGVGVFLFLRRRRQQKTTAGVATGAPYEHEKDDGGLPENVDIILELPKHPSFIAPAAASSSLHELNATDATDPYVGRAVELPQTPVHEPRQDLSASPPPPLQPAAISQKPVSPTPAGAIPAPWENPGYERYESNPNPASEPSVRTGEDLDIQRLEEEVAQIALKKQRLQSLQFLEEREEALKREIRKKRIPR